MEYKELLQSLYDQAKRKGACERFPQFDGRESLEHIAALMFTPQGREFCIKSRFPSLDALRAFKPYRPEQYGIYIDAGKVTIYDADCYIIGETRATIRLSDTKYFRVFLMHDAKAKIEAAGHAVVRVMADDKSTFKINQRDSAIILQ